MAVPPYTCGPLFAVPPTPESVLVAQVCRHELRVRGEGGTTVVTMFRHTLTGYRNISRRKTEEEELKAEDRSVLWEGSSRGGAHTGLVRSATAGGTSW
jgi:hypothetical protein